jgi:hypothetical protein
MAKYRARTELDAKLSLDSMTLPEVVTYAKNHPGEHEVLAKHIARLYDSRKLGALLETAAIMGYLNEPLFRILESESI